MTKYARFGNIFLVNSKKLMTQRTMKIEEEETNAKLRKRKNKVV